MDLAKKNSDIRTRLRRNDGIGTRVAYLSGPD
jgi:hypothetical protein